MSNPGCVGAACGSVLLLLAPAARPADPARYRADETREDRAPIVASLEWTRSSGAEGCIDRPTLEREVERRLERRVFADASQADVFLRGTVERAEADFRVQITMVAANGRGLGQRELRSDAPACSRLDESIALVVALAIDSLRALPAASLRVPKDAPRETWSARFAAPTFVGSWGLLPGFGFGLGLDTSVKPAGFWPIEVAWALFPWSQTAEVGGRGAKFTALQVGLFLCPVVFGARVDVRVCLGAEADYLRGSGFSLDIEHSPATVVLGPAARSVALFPLGRSWSVSAAFSASVPFLRDRFTYKTETGDVYLIHQPARVMLSLGIGLLVQIP